MSLFQEFKDIKDFFLSWFLSFLILTFVIFAIGFDKVNIFGNEFYVPIFSSNSLAVRMFEMIKNDLVPEGVNLIATSPVSAFVSQSIISLFTSLIVTFPFFLYKFIKYLSPALYPKEKKAILKVLAPSSLLFLGGAIFAYFIIIPPTFKVLYSFNTILGVAPFFVVSEFISWTLALMFTTGLMFLLPIFMYFLSWLGLIPFTFWVDNWRIALVAFLIISAIITPDGSGVTMVLLTTPMAFLYIIGIKISKKNGV